MDPLQPSNQRRWRGRAVTACLECQRRKKKCDRQWPCNHCQSRNMAHLCQFGALATRKHQQTHMKAPKEPSSSGSPASESQDDGASTTSAAAAVNVLGYVQSDMFGSIMHTAQSKDLQELLQPPEQVLQAARVVPPRPYTDMLVQNFFDNVNFHYAILHQPSFMAVYVEWWSQRREARHLRSIPAIALTCLILRICANSTQFLSPQSLSRLELDLGDSIANLSKSYHMAAQTLSNFVPPGAGGLVHAQQLFLAATWFKAEADFVKSWHELGAAVRQAQEIGIHIDSTSHQMSEFEMEIRRRLWCALYTWDRFMTAAFNRPPIIQSGCSIQPPSPALDQYSASPDIPSPVVAKILENQLARQFSEIDSGNKTSLADKLSYIDNWMSSLPSVFSVIDPDKRWDEAYLHLPFQRLQVHCVAYMTQLLFLRPTIISMVASSERSSAGDELESEKVLLTGLAIGVSLKAMSVSKDFFDLCFPQQAKYYMVAFCPFDNAALLCSLLIHDTDGTKVPRRLEIIGAIGQALYIARRLRGFTKMGDTTWSILSALKERIILQPSERKMLEETERSGKTDVNTDDPNQSCSNPPGLMACVNSLFQPVYDEEWQLLDPMFDEGALGLDLGILEGVWDWQRVGLEPQKSVLS